LLQERGNIEEKEMHGTFNMGVGLVIVVEKAMAEEILKHIHENNLVAFQLGNIISNSENKIIIN
jgi:phosphoribosylformylglycinamidine cyclo-ligase